jgi:hypothetical protein
MEGQQMIVKAVKCVIQVVSATFTAVIAPIIVNFAVLHLKDGHNITAMADNCSANDAFTSPGDRDIVVCHGVGCTATEARRDALRNALLQVLATLKEATAGCGAELGREAILAQPEVFVIRCEETADQMEPGCFAHRKEYLVEVARERLVEKLRAVAARVDADNRNLTGVAMRRLP